MQGTITGFVVAYVSGYALNLSTATTCGIKNI
jgi:hypothetical protein